MELGYDEVKGYNAHNQFLQFVLQYGFLLSILILILIARILTLLVKKKEELLLSFWIVLLMFCLSESILNRQWGVVFFPYFYAFLVIKFILKNYIIIILFIP